MRRRDVWVGPLALAMAEHAAAQASRRKFRIGVLRLDADNSLVTETVWRSFVQRLRELGYREGENLVIEQRRAELESKSYAPFAVEMVKLKVDAVLVITGEAARAVMALSQTIPVVAAFLPAGPVRAGLVNSLAHPGGQLTGISDLSDELVPKRLELLKAAVPSIKRVAYVRCPNCAMQAGLPRVQLFALYDEQEAAARAMGMSLVAADLSFANNFEQAAAIVRRENVDALAIGTTRINVETRDDWLAFAQAQGLPTMASYRGFGAMLSYGPDVAAMFAKAAEFVAKILGGARAGELPMEQPTRIEFVINLKLAKSLGLTIPQAILLRADEVIQ